MRIWSKFVFSLNKFLGHYSNRVRRYAVSVSNLIQVMLKNTWNQLWYLKHICTVVGCRSEITNYHFSNISMFTFTIILICSTQLHSRCGQICRCSQSLAMHVKAGPVLPFSGFTCTSKKAQDGHNNYCHFKKCRLITELVWILIIYSPIEEFIRF